MTDAPILDEHRLNLIAEMSPLIANVIQGPPSVCLTFNLEGDERRWVQYFDDQVNMACFADDQPDDLLERLGPSVVVAFEPRQYLTVTLAARDPESIAAWIYDWFQHALEAGDAFVLDAATEEL
ncbi:hypothetical protein N0B44_16125 [Roseibacterium beibuensis]|uniref:hypothetical protein n=1 Tax=[Roseibacterium] beibuensis TaxID=1193142 RepID=UPI00217D50FB|nr:hypothetical protein [Roseibacterium beibuensis]MCS6624447.1 hypothetical protein [Roseibacterium beibuensis]